ncbi:integration host factor subunit beta [Ectothiorhodospiraceae bacterium BW-2]|nr:integration host factor subunit beta [Ectothiorhodospiraceae bacterium BW-2]
MTRSDLINELATKMEFQLPPEDVATAVKHTLETMIESLAHGERIEIRGFGSFSPKVRPARVGRNPRTGEMVEVPEKRAVHFKPGKQLRERANGDE